MRYMLLIYMNETTREAMTAQEVEKCVADQWPVMDEMTKQGVFRGAEALQPASAATTVRVQDGKLLTTDGPFAETKEQLAGYYILDCKDLDEAIGWAGQIPMLRRGWGASIEVRPLRALPARPEQPQNEYANTVNG